MEEYSIIISFFIAGLAIVFGVAEITNERVFFCSLGCLILSIGSCYEDKIKDVINLLGEVLIIVSFFINNDKLIQAMDFTKNIVGITDNTILFFSMSFTILSIKLSKQSEEKSYYEQNNLNIRILNILTEIKKRLNKNNGDKN